MSGLPSWNKRFDLEELGAQINQHDCNYVKKSKYNILPVGQLL